MLGFFAIILPIFPKAAANPPLCAAICSKTPPPDMLDIIRVPIAKLITADNAQHIIDKGTNIVTVLYWKHGKHIKKNKECGNFSNTHFMKVLLFLNFENKDPIIYL